MTSIIWGVLIGLVVAMILVIILHYTVFKRQGKIWLYTLILLFFAIGGGFVQATMFKIANADVPTPQEQIETLTQTIKDGWKNTNGGFTFEQIQKVQEDEDAPTYADQIIDLKLTDFGSYVVFSYKNGSNYENALFYKSSNGLILDGVANTTAEYGMHAVLGTIGNFVLENFKWNRELNKEPYYFEETGWFSCHYDNIVSLSRQSAYFVKDIEGGLFCFNRGEASKNALQEASVLTGKNAVDKFVKFGIVELIGSADESYLKINSFFNYLYDQSKGEKYDTTKIVDATKCLCVPIPVLEKSNYPIPASKQEEYGDAEYYGVYDCDIAVALKITKGKTVTSYKINEDYINTLKKDNKTKDKIQVETVDAQNDFTKINVSFRKKQACDLTNVNLNTNPVVITFTSGNETKTLRITDKNTLTSGTVLLLSANKTWNYTISSEAILFDDFQGSFALGKTTGSLAFEYYYLDNYVVASVGLNAVGNVDMNTLDLANNPVKIILSNNSHRYEFTFSDNSSFTQYISQTVELGEYNYTILSNQLEFASTSGTLTITTTDKTMLFNCALIEDENNLVFRTVTQQTIKNNVSACKLSIVIRIPEQIYLTIDNSNNITAKIYEYENSSNQRLVEELYFSISDFEYNSTEHYYSLNKVYELSGVNGDKYLFQLSTKIDDSIILSDSQLLILEITNEYPTPKYIYLFALENDTYQI